MKCVIFCFGLLLSLFHATSGNEACSTAKPDFKAPGRRISEEKCREYNWVRKCSSQDGEVNKHPYMGAIAFKREGEVKFMCNAFLISPKFAVTAAHCVRGAQHSIPEFVRFGNKNLKDVPVTDAKIISTIVHPEYTPAKISFDFDIALLEFERALLVSQAVAPTCLWAQPEVATNQDLQVPGWASTEEDSKIEVLRTMTVQAIDSKTCEPLIQQYYNRRFMKLADHHLCVNESDTKNYFYRGSSGAPIVTPVPLGDGDEMPYVQAFASFGLTGIQPRIGFYVKIASFVDWIEQTVWS